MITYSLQALCVATERNEEPARTAYNFAPVRPNSRRKILIGYDLSVTTQGKLEPGHSVSS